MQKKRDFFVSYTKDDVRWAVWISWALEKAGYSVAVQVWDFVVGSNWVNDLDEFMRDPNLRMIAVWSNSYSNSKHAMAEARAAWEVDRNGENRKVIPVIVDGSKLSGLFRNVTAVQLFNLGKEEALRQLLNGVAGTISGRNKPTSEPDFPGQPAEVPKEPPFPGPGGRARFRWLLITVAIIVAIGIAVAVPLALNGPGNAKASAGSSQSTKATASNGAGLAPAPSNTVSAQASNTVSAQASNTADQPAASTSQRQSAAGGAAETPAASVLPGGTLAIHNAQTGYCMDTTPQGNVFTNICHGGSDQQWTALAASGSLYLLQNMSTGLCLSGVPQGLVSAACNTSLATQQWLWHQNGDQGTFTHKSNGHCLVDEGGERLTSATCSGAADQDWLISS